MRNKLSFLVVVVLASLVLSACAGAVQAAEKSSAGALQATEAASLRTLSVTGSSRVMLTPDIAYIYVGVHSEDEDATLAVSANSEQTQQVIDALVAAGIAERDIQTTNFSVYPRQDFGPNGETLDTITFVVDNSVYVTVRDIDRLGDVLNEAMSAGANSISGITFDVADKSAALSDAREQAIADAQSQAEELAAAAGVTLGQIHAISTYNAASPQPIYGYGMGGAAAADMAASVPISPGQLTITMDVNVVYEIE